MLGIEDKCVAAAYVLCIASAIICVVYGLLSDNGFVARITDVVAVEVEDKPGGLASVLMTLADGNLNIEYMYGFAEKHGDKALLVFRFENADEAIKVLSKMKVKIVGEQEVKGL